MRALPSLAFLCACSADRTPPVEPPDPWTVDPIADPKSVDTSTHDEMPTPVVPDAPVTPDAPPREPMPDLVPIASMMGPTIQVTREFFPGDSCAVAECLNGWGWRNLIRFATSSANLGDEVLRLGPPDPSSALWEWNTCHQHWHYLNFANYQLKRLDGTVVANGHKTSFCLLDVAQITPGAPSEGFTCNNQGISIGWADVYASALDCQWIDVTGVAPGQYMLTVELNPNRLIEESDYTNNTAAFPVTIP